MVRAAGETGQGDCVPPVSPAFWAQERRGDLSGPGAQRTGQGELASPARLQRLQQSWAQEQAVSSLCAWGESFLLLAMSFYCLVPQATLSSVVSWGTVD